MSADAIGDPVGPASPAGEIYQAMVERLLAREYERRRLLEARGATLMTSSASVLALIFGLTVIVTGKDFVFHSHVAILALCGALAGFVLSALMAIIVQTHLPEYDVPGCDYLAGLTESHDEWAQSADYALRVDVGQQVRTICSLRPGNSTKAKLVAGSLTIQVAAVALLAFSVAFELIRSELVVW
ncbi:hypothetical protein [Mycolicibacterium sp. 120270]|uniref:hypothetical protein n=1 Tax=Mycolicibacterium sp. 120270 TaxID=3090600 RepID=UPI00299D8B15|nr:hypothetical protein [Mycolicibacterium sp. 120270]MDX1883042.1 hypothetical protein [Mycolicibacterium sp. 120270]